MSNDRRLYTYLICLGLYLIPMWLAAGEDKSLHCDLQTCIDLAFTNHPMLKAAERSVDGGSECQSAYL